MAGALHKFEVLRTEGAEKDLEAFHDYMSDSDSDSDFDFDFDFDCVANANYVLDALMVAVQTHLNSRNAVFIRRNFAALGSENAARLSSSRTG